MPIQFEDEHSHEEVASLQTDMQLYLEQLNQEEITRVETAQVIDIRSRQLAPQHTDDELVPMSPADFLFSKLDFDMEAALLRSNKQRWLIDSMVPADSFGILYGPSGSYKSFIAIDMAASIATGRKWHGVDIDSPGPVLYVAAEGANGVRERFLAWSKHHGCSYGKIAVMPIPMMLDDPKQLELFRQVCVQASEAFGEPIAMIVVDTMARSHNGDENSAQDVGQLINACFSLKTDLDGVSIMMVAHAGKTADRGIRGSSALKAACDFVYLVSKADKLNALMKNEKQKDIDEAPDMRFALQHVDIGIPDHKDRKRMSLVPILESKGAEADFDSEEFIDAFQAADMNDLVHLLKATLRVKPEVTEVDLRNEYVAREISNGVKPDTVKTRWRRQITAAKNNGLIVKKGLNLVLGGMQL